MKPTYPSLIDLIGNTPVARLDRINPNPRVTLLAKLEGHNPGGSVKDRIAWAMIRDAEESGKLKPGITVLEATSGNTGIGLAMICALRGHRLLLAMSEGVSLERRKILAAYGAEFLLTPAAMGTDGAIERVYEMEREDGGKTLLLVDQYNNPANPRAHYETTGPEIWRQTNGEVTHFVAGIGTTGTVVGTGRYLKERNPDVKVIAAEPKIGHGLQGLKSLKEAYVPGIWDKSVVDEKTIVQDQDAMDVARRLAREEGLLAGMSAGAALFLALQKAREIESGTIVALLPDGGERYLSTRLFDGGAG